MTGTTNYSTVAASGILGIDGKRNEVSNELGDEERNVRLHFEHSLVWYLLSFQCVWEGYGDGRRTRCKIYNMCVTCSTPALLISVQIHSWHRCRCREVDEFESLTETQREKGG